MACCASCASQEVANRVDAQLRAPADLAAQWPRTTKVLHDWAVSQIRQGRPFFVSAHFNSTVLNPPSGFGFFAEIAAAAASIASSIGSVVGPAAEVAAVVHQVQGSGGGSSSGSGGVTADQIAQAILPNVQAQLAQKGITLPASVAQQAVSASILDSFGPQYHNLVLFGGLALAGLVLFKLVSR